MDTQMLWAGPQIANLCADLDALRQELPTLRLELQPAAQANIDTVEGQIASLIEGNYSLEALRRDAADRERPCLDDLGANGGHFLLSTARLRGRRV